MSDETKKSIEELKGVVMDLHRTAGELDRYIQILEDIINKDDSVEYLGKVFTTYQRQRLDFQQMHGYSNLNDKETNAWLKLINSVKEEET